MVAQHIVGNIWNSVPHSWREKRDGRIYLPSGSAFRGALHQHIGSFTSISGPVYSRYIGGISTCRQAPIACKINIKLWPINTFDKTRKIVLGVYSIYCRWAVGTGNVLQNAGWNESDSTSILTIRASYDRSCTRLDLFGLLFHTCNQRQHDRYKGSSAFEVVDIAPGTGSTEHISTGNLL